MVEIDGRLILWQIRKFLSSHGINECMICCAYKSYSMRQCCVSHVLQSGELVLHSREFDVAAPQENGLLGRPLVETGETSMPGILLKSMRGEVLYFTYGDGSTDVDIAALIAHQKVHGRLGNLWATSPQRGTNLAICSE